MRASLPRAALLLGLGWFGCQEPPAPLPPPAPPPAKTDGAVSINSDPAGATVLLDGQPGCAPTPCTLENVRFGAHQLVLQHPDYEDFTRALKTSEETAPIEIPLRLEGKLRGAGTVALSIEGEKAAKLKGQIKVFLPGSEEPLAITDTLAVTVPGGKRSLLIQRAGYAPLTKEIELPSGGAVTLSIAAAEWVEAKVTLVVDSSPVKGKVTVDGALIGTAPVTIPDLGAAKPHTVKITAEGFDDFSTTARWKDGSPLEIKVNATLDQSKPSGYVKIISTPLIGLTVYIDGEKTRYTTPTGGQGIKLPAGTHTIALQSAAGKRFEGYTIEVKADQTITKNIKVQ